MKQKNHNRRIVPPKSSSADPAKKPFIEHAYELRRRLYYVVISIVCWGTLTYFVQEHVVNILLKPARGESFIYTTPGGGIDFLFRICIYSGLIFSLPIIVYNVLRFIEPLITRSSKQFILWGSVISGVLAIAGIIFGYYVGLPAALHFLTHQFTTVQIKPLVTIQSYLKFVIVYMVGSAMLFQLPLMLLFINRVKPLKPRRLLHYERWVILAAFVLSGLMNPTPNIISQLLIAGPFIGMYQLGILLIAFINRQNKTTLLYQQDLAAQASRNARLQTLQAIPFEPVLFNPAAVNEQTPVNVPPPQAPQTVRPRTVNTMNFKRRTPLRGEIRTRHSTPLRFGSIDRLPENPL